MTQKKSNFVAIVTMCFIFAMISFVTNMAAPFGNLWSYQYEWAGMWGNLMNFTAYLFMGIPAGNMIIKYGYKKTALIALAVGVLGLGVQYVSSFCGAGVAVFSVKGQVVALNLIIYLLGALICGFCVCMLNTVVNPMLNLLGGGGNRGNQLIQIGGTCNSLSATLTPMLTGVLVGTLSASTSMKDVAPLVIAGMCIFAVAFVIISFIKIEEPQGDLSKVTYEKSPVAFRHCLLGIISIFFYVGVEIGIPGELNAYLSHMTDAAGNPVAGAAAAGGILAGFYWALMLCGRFISSFISGKVGTRTQMIVVTSVAIAFLLVAIFLPESVTMMFKSVAVPVKCVFIFACGICTSIMWGGIFNLSTEGLGKYTAKASGLFMTMVVGGGIMPLLQDAIGRSAGYINSYWLIIAMLAFILYYSIWGCKNFNKDIPVD